MAPELEDDAPSNPPHLSSADDAARPPGEAPEAEALANGAAAIRGWVEHGTPVVLMAGKPLGKPKVTTMIAIHYIGYFTGFRSHDG